MTMTPIDLAALYMDVVPHAMREYRKEMLAAGAGALSVAQFRALALVRFAPANNRTLAAELGVSVAAMSRMVDQLCRHGLIERRAHARDRRQVLIVMTEVGEKTFESFRGEARRRLETRLCRLNVQQQQEMKKALAFLAGALEQMNLATEGK